MLSAYLIDREYDHWQSLYDHGQVSVEPTTMARIVYAATLSGPLPRDQAIRVLSLTRLASGEDAARLVDGHAVCYPPAPGAVQRVFQPLYPDHLGEDFIALRSPGSGHVGYQADAWASDALVRIAAPADEAVTPWTQAAMTTLIYAAARWHHVGREYLFPLLRRYPRLAQTAGGTALAELAGNQDVDQATLNAIYTIRPHHSHADAGVGFAEIATRLNSLLPSHAPPAQRLLAYQELAWQLSETGYFEGNPAYMLRAAEAIDKALALGRRGLRWRRADSELRQDRAAARPVPEGRSRCGHAARHAKAASRHLDGTCHAQRRQRNRN